MEIKRVSYYATCMIALSITNAQATVTQACFESKADYEKYLKIGDGLASKPVQGQGYDPYGLKYDAALKEWKKSLPKRKGISIKIESVRNEDTDSSTYDGSGTTTPSGIATYKWEERPQDREGSTGSRVNFTVPYGLMGQIELTVTDPVCEITQSGTMTIYESK